MYKQTMMCCIYEATERLQKKQHVCMQQKPFELWKKDVGLKVTFKLNTQCLLESFLYFWKKLDSQRHGSWNRSGGRPDIRQHGSRNRRLSGGRPDIRRHGSWSRSDRRQTSSDEETGAGLADGQTSAARWTLLASSQICVVSVLIVWTGFCWEKLK